VRTSDAGRSGRGDLITEVPRSAAHGPDAVAAVAVPVADDGDVAGRAVRRGRGRRQVVEGLRQHPVAIAEGPDAVGAVAVPVARDRDAGAVAERQVTPHRRGLVARHGTDREDPLRSADDAEVGGAVAVPVPGDRNVARLPERRGDGRVVGALHLVPQLPLAVVEDARCLHAVVVPVAQDAHSPVGQRR
jgi:hypothetical protein